ncbi:hypothetical protein [Sabulibacter ruber]|uniref:hypothetical protein n=1 Tax=Sabulibacter ruber TaxID=2811901 RepID=UPI001A96C071|nr:hypothetical protein [Sabulibacter ruber]
MRNKIYKRFAVGIGLLSPSLVQAQKAFFVPEPLVMPVHSQGNQLHLSAGVGGGVGLVTSYAITNHLAVYISGTRNPWTSSHTSLLGGRYKVDHNDYAIAGGVGYLINPESERWVVEVYGGAARHSVDNLHYSVSLSYEDPGTKTDASYWSFNGQVNLNKRTKRLELGGGIRMTYNAYDKFQFQDYAASTDTRLLYKDLWSINAEPVGNLSIVMGRFKINGQAGISVPIVEKERNVYVQNVHTLEEGMVGGRIDKVGIAAFILRFGLQYNLDLGND